MRLAWRQSAASQLLRGLASPALLGGFAASAGCMLLVRLPFLTVQTLPGWLGFNPGIGLIPLAGIIWGPGGAWGALAAALAGDALAGLWGTLTPYRAAGALLAALTAQRLWVDLPGSLRVRDLRRASGRSMLRYLGVALPAGWLSAAWPALGAEVNRLYPFAYYFALQALYATVFILIAGLPLFRLAAGRMAEKFGDWQTQLGERPSAGPGEMRAAWLVALAAGSGWAGTLFSAILYRISPTQPYLIGTRSGPALAAIVGILLAAHALAVFLPPPKKP